uniref:Huntingtin interacting protein K n=8 Tax=Salmonidae TaxID=8015 RepID=A0A8C8FQ39_ONCTS
MTLRFGKQFFPGSDGLHKWTFWVYMDGFNRKKDPIVMFMGHIGVPTKKLVKGANMAAEGDVDLDLEAEENCTGKPAEKPRKHDSGAADLERVTDYAEEKEISSSDLETAMSVIGDRRSREQKAKQDREKELAKVTIKKEDVELIMGEMEISRGVAERSLREHMGNVVEALIDLSN